MLAAISGPVLQAVDRVLGAKAKTVAASTPSDWRSDWFVFMVADVSDETAAEITKAEAWPAFTAFFRLLWKRQREAEKARNEKAVAACQAGVLLDEGIRGLARSIGLSPKAMNRQVAELHRLGILAVAKPPASVERDEKGRMIRRPAHRGLVPASKLRFTAGDQHRRPGNRQGSNRPLKVVVLDGGQGSNRPLKGGRFKGRNDTTPISPKNISLSTGGHADGIGRPVEEKAPPAPWTGTAAEAYQATMRRLEAEKARREAEDAAWREQRQAAPVDATKAAADLQAAVAELPPASRQKARRVAKRMTKTERQAAAEAARLNEIIEEKMRQERDRKHGEAAATADAAKDTFKARKAKARTVVTA